MRKVVHVVWNALVVLLVHYVSVFIPFHFPTSTSFSGSLSTVFFGIGYIPQFYEIYKTAKVEGISLLFLGIDITGSVLSVVSLALQESFEPVSGACYIVVFVCDVLIVILYYLLPILYKPVHDVNSMEIPQVESDSSNRNGDVLMIPVTENGAGREVIIIESV